MKWLLHPASWRYALALWLATMAALWTAFFLQLEPAQWAAITVWIMFVQTPHLNYSKIVWWAFGTITGAFMAVVLIALFNQAPELCLLFLALWLACCAAAATFVTSYRAYGGVLAGYTCAIVTMSAVDHPDQVFKLAATRVSCIAIGMTSAVLFINLILPKHRHWENVRHFLGNHFKETLLQAARALKASRENKGSLSWRHTVDRMVVLEHALDVTTAETSDSRSRTPQARSLVSTLFDVMAGAQAIELHLSRPETPPVDAKTEALLNQTGVLLTDFATDISAEFSAHDLKMELARRQQLGGNRFVLDRLAEMLESVELARADWAGLHGEWKARRSCVVEVHRDYRTAFIYGLRMFSAMAMVSVLWFITRWPSGSQLILFTAVVCSLLSLLDEATLLGMEFVKSAVFCFVMAGIETFWWLQWGEGFLTLALMLGIFLVPAGYAYRHPRLVGGAVVSMLIFDGLTMPSNQMTYDAIAYLNNGAALLGAVICGFFAFHFVPSLTQNARQLWLRKAMRHDLAYGGHGGPGWASLVYDRVRLLHRAFPDAISAGEYSEAETEILLGLQLGLRRDSLRGQLNKGLFNATDAVVVEEALKVSHDMVQYPGMVALYWQSACAHFHQRQDHQSAAALADLSEMAALLKSSAGLYLSNSYAV